MGERKQQAHKTIRRGTPFHRLPPYPQSSSYSLPTVYLRHKLKNMEKMMSRRVMFAIFIIGMFFVLCRTLGTTAPSSLHGEFVSAAGGGAHVVQLDPREWKEQQQALHREPVTGQGQGQGLAPITAPVKATDVSVINAGTPTNVDSAKDEEQKARQDPPKPKRYMYIIDYWERLNNIHQAMRMLIRLAKVSDFTLVEPFMYESMVMARLATPAQFAQTELQVQTASKYMNLQHVFDTGKFVTYDNFSQSVAKRIDGGAGTIVDAALYIFWDDAPVPLPLDRKKGALFECDDIFLKVGYKEEKAGWKVAPDFHAKHALCIFGEKVASPLPRDKFIQSMFEMIEDKKKTSASDARAVCPHCTTMVVLNYRKHLFESLPASSEEMDWFLSFRPSLYGEEMASIVHERAMSNRSYVAIQYRTGRTLTRIREMARGHEETDGVREVVADEYRTWVFACAETLIQSALRETEKMKREKALPSDAETGFFLASDMFNEGWKHGEYNNAETEKVMKDLVGHFEQQLHGIVTFDPTVVGLTQDIMGLAAVGDAAVAYRADRFVAHDTSSMGWYVGECRQEWRGLNSSIEACTKPEQNRTVIERIETAIKNAEKK